MIAKPPNPPLRLKQLTIVWQDSAWFPTVGQYRPQLRRQVNWRVQIITDPTVCLGRAFTLIKP